MNKKIFFLLISVLCLCVSCDWLEPEYEEIKPNHYCSICNEGIYDGEEYIENDTSEYAHWECIDGKFSMAEWLKIRIKVMDV